MLRKVVATTVFIMLLGLSGQMQESSGPAVLASRGDSQSQISTVTIRDGDAYVWSYAPKSQYALYRKAPSKYECEVAVQIKLPVIKTTGINLEHIEPWVCLVPTGSATDIYED